MVSSTSSNPALAASSLISVVSSRGMSGTSKPTASRVRFATCQWVMLPRTPPCILDPCRLGNANLQPARVNPADCHKCRLHSCKTGKLPGLRGCSQQAGGLPAQSVLTWHKRLCNPQEYHSLPSCRQQCCSCHHAVRLKQWVGEDQCTCCSDLPGCCRANNLCMQAYT